MVTLVVTVFINDGGLVIGSHLPVMVVVMEVMVLVISPASGDKTFRSIVAVQKLPQGFCMQTSVQF